MYVDAVAVCLICGEEGIGSERGLERSKPMPSSPHMKKIELFDFHPWCDSIWRKIEINLHVCIKKKKNWLSTEVSNQVRNN